MGKEFKMGKEINIILDDYLDDYSDDSDDAIQDPEREREIEREEASKKIRLKLESLKELSKESIITEIQSFLDKFAEAHYSLCDTEDRLHKEKGQAELDFSDEMDLRELRDLVDDSWALLQYAIFNHIDIVVESKELINASSEKQVGLLALFIDQCSWNPNQYSADEQKKFITTYLENNPNRDERHPIVHSDLLDIVFQTPDQINFNLAKFLITTNVTWNRPFPDKAVMAIKLEQWGILKFFLENGVTLFDQPFEGAGSNKRLINIFVDKLNEIVTAGGHAITPSIVNIINDVYNNLHSYLINRSILPSQSQNIIEPTSPGIGFWKPIRGSMASMPTSPEQLAFLNNVAQNADKYANDDPALLSCSMKKTS